MSQRDFSHGKFGLPSPGESQLQQSCATQRTVHAGCLSVSLIHRTQTRRTVHRRCYLKILRISYKDHVTYEEVCAKIQQAIRPHEDLLTIVKRHKLQWYGHVSRSSDLAKTILQGTVKGGKKTRQRGGKTASGIIDGPGVRQVPEGSGE